MYYNLLDFLQDVREYIRNNEFHFVSTTDKRDKYYGIRNKLTNERFKFKVSALKGMKEIASEDNKKIIQYIVYAKYKELNEHLRSLI
jgi:hypothetical protein